MLRFSVPYRELYDVYKENRTFNFSQRNKAVSDYLIYKEKLYNNEKVINQLKTNLAKSFLNNLKQRLMTNKCKRIRWERFEKSNSEWLKEDFYFLYIEDNFSHESGMFFQ